MNKPYEWTWKEAATLKVEMLRVRRLLEELETRGEKTSGEIGLPKSRATELGIDGGGRGTPASSALGIFRRVVTPTPTRTGSGT